MGKEAQKLLGTDIGGKTALILAGSESADFTDQVLGRFDRVVSRGDRLPLHGYVVEGAGEQYSLVVGAYGGPHMHSVITSLQDGGAERVVVVGYTYAGFSGEEANPGRVIIPEEVYDFTGDRFGRILPLSLDQRVRRPDLELSGWLAKALSSSSPLQGSTISVYAVSEQPRHHNELYDEIGRKAREAGRIRTVEMELAAAAHAAETYGLRFAAALIVSDNRERGIDDKGKRERDKLPVIDAIVDALGRVDFPALESHGSFSIRERLGTIIHDPANGMNVYSLFGPKF